jgi:hypothetical protein
VQEYNAGVTCTRVHARDHSPRRIEHPLNDARAVRVLVARVGVEHRPVRLVGGGLRECGEQRRVSRPVYGV